MRQRLKSQGAMLVAALVGALAAFSGTSAEAPALDDAQFGPGLAGRKIVQVAFVVTDLDRARRFYKETLGLPLLFEAGEMLFFDADGQRLMVGKNGGSGLAPGGGIIYFDAPDFDRLSKDLLSRGVAFIAPVEILQRTSEYELRLREFEDPDGNRLAIMGKAPVKKP